MIDPPVRESAPQATPRGLTAAEAAARLARDGPNRIVPEVRRRRVQHLLGPLADPMVALLLVAAPTYLAIGDTTDAVVAFVALGPIAAVGWLLQARSERTLDRLRRLTAPVAVVWRDGVATEVAAEDLVVDDVVALREGDIVPADGAVVDVTQVAIDESALTGESLPVAKSAATGRAEGGGDAAVWAGTTVLSGRAVMRVTATGPATRYGRIGALVASVQAPATPLQRGLAHLVRGLAIAAAVFCAAVIGAELLHGDGWGEAVIAGVSLAIAAIPEEFTMIYTLYLGLGAWRLAQQHALVRRLPSVETLGSTTVICTDKTGTLTLGRLDVAGVWTPQGFAGDHEPLGDAARRVVEGAVLASEPDPFDPLDLAIVAFAAEHGVDVAGLHAQRLVADWPFDSAERYLTHVWRDAVGRCRVAAKGSIEGVVAHSLATPEDCQAIDRANDALAAAGTRVIAVALGEIPGATGERARDEQGLRFAGLVAFRDPIREGVGEALAECRTAGIRVIMITGDHPSTAHAVAEGLGLPHEDAAGDVIAVGDELDALDDAGLGRLARTANVFARTRPEQKHRLVRALRAQGEVVAMTGDGINDAPALREADIGVAMGRRGTEVAREAASLVLLDDNFTTIVNAVRDGRRIFDNLIRAFAYLIAFHPPLLLAALVVPLLNRPLLLLPVHLVVLELLLHPLVSLVFQADPGDPDLMRRRPRAVGDALRLRTMWRPYAVGLVLAGGVLAEYLIALDRGWEAEPARALGFATLLASQPLLLLSMRSPDRPVWQPPARWTKVFIIATAVVVAVMIAVVYLEPLGRLLKLAPFPPAAWLVVAGVAGVTTLWSEPLKRTRPSG